jgi:hypothetical protein
MNKAIANVRWQDVALPEAVKDARKRIEGIQAEIKKLSDAELLTKQNDPFKLIKDSANNAAHSISHVNQVLTDSAEALTRLDVLRAEGAKTIESYNQAFKKMEDTKAKMSKPPEPDIGMRSPTPAFPGARDERGVAMLGKIHDTLLKILGKEGGPGLSAANLGGYG